MNDQGRGFAYFAHYRWVKDYISASIEANCQKFIGQTNTAEVRQQMVEAMSNALDQLRPRAFDLEVDGVVYHNYRYAGVVPGSTEFSDDHCLNMTILFEPGSR